MVQVSVITATWNCGPALIDCLDSVRAQDYARREHVIVDGASTDGTLELLQSRRADFTKMVSGRDGGIYPALNRGLALASGDVVGFLHGDDLYADGRVLSRVAAAFADPAVQGVYGDLQYVRADDTTRVVRHWQAGRFSRRQLRLGWMPPHPTLYLRREWYERIGGFDTRYRIAGDYDSILKLFSAPGFQAAYIPEVLVRMRVGGASNRSLRALWRKSSEDLRALRASGVGGWATLACKNLRKVVQFR